MLQDLLHNIVVAADNRGGHVFDGTPADNLVLRILRPAESSLTPSRDYLRGRSVDAVVLAALDRSITALTATYGADPSGWRDRHPRSTVYSLTAVIGPQRTMPYQDRGSWVHVVAFNGGGSRPALPDAPVKTPLAATGPGPGLATLGLLLLGLALLALRRLRPAS